MIRDPEKTAILIQDDLDWAALGYTLHVLYTSMENYFLRISKFFENDLPRDARHKELLERMELEIPGIRPALLDRNTALLLMHGRAFRVFRPSRVFPGRSPGPELKTDKKYPA